MEGKTSDDEGPASPSRSGAGGGPGSPAPMSSPRAVSSAVVVPSILQGIPGVGLLFRGIGLVHSVLSVVVSPLERLIGAGSLPPPNGAVRVRGGLHSVPVPACAM